MSLLEFHNVSFLSENELIVNNLCLNIDSGDFISIIGPSGGGKSTFLKLCCHLYSPSKGNIYFKDKDMLSYNPMELRKTICYCFQMPHLFGEIVLDNLIFPFKVRNKPLDMCRLKYLINLFNLGEDILHKNIKNLSGGERQRIALIRSLAFKPEVLLLDEVTSALDVDNTIIVENVVSTLNQEGITVLWVTHDLRQSKKYANKLLTIEKGSLKSVEVLK